MSTFTAESHRGAGTLPVPSTPLSSQVQDDGLVLVDGPMMFHDTSVISNADVGEERSFIGPIESVLIRGRGTNQAINAQSVGLTLTHMAPPWPNVNVSADLSARHGSAEQVTQQSTVADRSTAEDDLRPLRRPGNRTRSPVVQPTYAPTTFSEKLQILEDRLMALESSHAEGLRDHQKLSNELRLSNDHMEKLQMEVTERTAEAMQRIDQHHVLISRVDEKLDTVVEMLKRNGTQNFEISTPVQKSSRNYASQHNGDAHASASSSISSF